MFVDKNKSIKSIFRFLIGDYINMKMMCIVTLKNNKVYLFGYGAPEEQFDNNIPMVDKMVNSIKIY